MKELKDALKSHTRIHIEEKTISLSCMWKYTYPLSKFYETYKRHTHIKYCFCNQCDTTLFRLCNLNLHPITLFSLQNN